MKKQKYFDWVLLLILMLLLSLSFITLYSATKALSHRYVFRQLIWMILGFGVFFILSHLNVRTIGEISWIIYFFCLALLFWVLIMGRSISGSKRWIDLCFFNVQPSEFMKLAYIIALSWYFDGLSPQNKTFKKVLYSVVITIIPMIFIGMQPDLGTALVFVPIYVSVLFVAGFSLIYFVFLLGCGIFSIPVFWFFILKPYQKKRILMFLNPQNDQFGFGWTINQSKIAIGSGEFFGKGWMSGSQTQLNFLPEHHTDFIFSVFGEEFGFLGISCLFFLFFAFFTRSLIIAAQTRFFFARYVIVGIVILIFFQTIINIGMTFGVFPITGLPLPFFSYGGSSLLVNFACLGLIMSVYRHR